MIDRERIRKDEAYREGVADGIAEGTMMSMSAVVDKIQEIIDDEGGS